jgi:hypothetical protein
MGPVEFSTYCRAAFFFITLCRKEESVDANVEMAKRLTPMVGWKDT